MRGIELTARTLITAALLTGCSDSPTEPSVSTRPNVGEPRPIVHLSVNPRSATIRSGETIRLTAVPSGQPAGVAELLGVTWESENEEVARVDEDGLVSGGTPGQVRIRARYGTAFAGATITVLKGETTQTPCLSIVPKSDAC